MAVLAQNQPSPNDPAPTLTLSPDDIRKMFDQTEGALGGTRPEEMPIVPLWVQRPTATAPNQAKPYGFQEFSDLGDISTATQTFTRDYAETAWYNLSPQEQEAFAERAQKAGMWDPSDGPYGLFRAWVQAVGNAAQYNSARSNDKDKWISPFEALEKLAADNIAGMNGTINGFTGWRSQRTKQVVKFNEEQIGRTATDVLQRELGRDPTEDEIRAYTVAANQAAARNPHILTERTRVTKFDEQGNPIDTESERTVEGEQFDPTETIEDMAQSTDENEAYKAAAVYMPALMQALGSVV